MLRVRCLIIFLLGVHCVGSRCAAEPPVRVTFPLDGYYRPGKYMPVRIGTTNATAAPVVLRAEGAVSVSVGPGASAIDAVVPWLACDVVCFPRWQLAGVGEGAVDAALVPVEPSQVLVGVVGADAAASTAGVAELFPGRPVVAVTLAATPPMPGHPVAWEALDAAVFDEPDHVFLAELLGQGVSVMVRSQAKPGGRWPWQGGPGRWFVPFDAAGPRGALHPEVYAPVAPWRPGWPAPARRRAVLLAMVFCLVALATTLWRRTWAAALGVVVVAVASAAGFGWWGSRQPAVRELITGVEVCGPGGTQNDHWSYYRPLRPCQIAITWQWRTKPVFASAGHLRETDIHLDVGAAGRPSGFTWQSRAGVTLAFLGRRFDPSVGIPGPTTRTPPSSPTRELVAECYAAPGDVASDDARDAAGSDDGDWSEYWPPITVQRPAR
jgi:hypothetical protein